MEENRLPKWERVVVAPRRRRYLFDLSADCIDHAQYPEIQSTRSFTSAVIVLSFSSLRIDLCLTLP